MRQLSFFDRADGGASIGSTCCFTGHRPEKLKAGEAVLKAALWKEITDAFEDEFSCFISGMSRGVDLWAAELVLKLREMHPEVRLVCAVPFVGFADKWNDYWQGMYDRTMKEANEVRFICDKYNAGVFAERNRWMVDNSARVIAVNNGTSGGTVSTIRYAVKQHREIVIIDDIAMKGLE